MAFVKKYELDVGNSLHYGYGVTCEIYKDGYSGASTYLKGSRSPIQLEMLSAEAYDKYSAIHGSVCILQIVSPSADAYSEFAEFTDKDYLVIVKLSTVEKWRGYLIPEEYKHRHDINGNHFIELRASDGLGSLKGIEYRQDTGDWYAGKASLLTMLYRVLNKTELTLGLRENCNVYETHMNSTAADTPFDQTYLDALIAFKNDGTFLSMYDVLSGIIRGFGARIYQWGGYWHIERIEELKDSYIRRTYNSFFVYQSNEVITDENLVEHSATGVPIADFNRFINTSAFREYIPAAKRILLTHDLGKKDNLINSQWTKYDWLESDELPEPWVNSLAACSYSQEGLKILVTTNPFYKMDYEIGKFYLIKSAGTFDDYTYKFEFSARMHQSDETDQNIIRAYFQYDDGNLIKYYDYTTERWSITSKPCIYHKTDEDGLDINFSFTLPRERAALCTFTFYLYVYQDPAVGSLTDYLIIPDDGIKFYAESDFIQTSNSYIYRNDDNYTSKPDPIEMTIGDMPDHDSNVYFYKNGLFYLSGTDYLATQLWNRRGKTDNKNLLSIIRDEIAGQYNNVTYNVSAQLVAHFTFGTIFKQNDVYYIIDKCTYDILSDVWNVTLLEIDRDEAHILTESAGDIIALESASGGLLKE